jgi:outer membrane protein OmpA-like peptidoglycan-associated protein
MQGFVVLAAMLSACTTTPEAEERKKDNEPEQQERPSASSSWFSRAFTQDRLEDNLRKNPHLSVKELERGSLNVVIRSGDSFKGNTSTPTPTLLEVLDHVARSLDGIITTYEITVVGHSDDTGDSSFRHAIAQRRADVVRHYLVSKGVDPRLTVTTSKGDSEPLISNSAPGAREVNRRVDLLFRPTRMTNRP